MLKKTTIENAILWATFTIVAILCKLNQYSLVNIFILILCSVLLFKNRKLLILIYIITVPTNGFISTEYNLFGVFHPSYTINLYAMFSLYLERKILQREWIGIPRKIHGIKKYAFSLTLFLFFYLLFTDYRLSFLGMEEISKSLLFTRTIRYCVMFLPLLLLIKLSYIEKYQKIILKGFLISIALISISIIFSEEFYQIGFTTQETNIYLNTDYYGEGIRKGGIFRLGDVNSAAGFMAISFAFILFSDFSVYGPIKKYILLVLSILAVIVTGSRTGLASFILVMCTYFSSLNVKTNKKILYTLFIVIIFAVMLYTNFLDRLLDRFSELKAGKGHLDPNFEKGRLGGWIFYLNYILSDIKIFFLGTFKSIYGAVGWYNIAYERVAHNFYIQLWYYWGIFSVVIFFSILIKYLRYSLRETKKTFFISLIVPFCLTLMFVSDTGAFMGIILSLMAIEYEKKFA